MIGKILFVYLFLINCLAFFMYADDKRRALFSLRRTQNAVLQGLAIIGGAYGAAMGMLLFRHKTKQTSYLTIVPVALTLWLAAVVLLCIFAK